MSNDNWAHRSENMRCRTCMYWVRKMIIDKSKIESTEQGVPGSAVGRCRRHAPTMSGWPVLFAQDWCGNHKLDENAI